MKKDKLYISKPLIIRSRTNDNEKAKLTFEIMGSNNDDMALLIHKLVLTDKTENYNILNFELLRIWKGLFVFEQHFSIKTKTLVQVTDWIYNLSQ